MEANARSFCEWQEGVRMLRVDTGVLLSFECRGGRPGVELQPAVVSGPPSGSEILVSNHVPVGRLTLVP
jgi:hypothetical protein